MWYRVFIASNIVFLFGIFAVFLGDYLVPALAPFTLPAGALLAGVSGIVFAISGIALIRADVRA